MCTYSICPYSNVHLQHMSIPSINECFTPYTFFHKPLNYFFISQCNEHVEMNKFLCSLACTWMTIIDSHFHIIDN